MKIGKKWMGLVLGSLLSSQVFGITSFARPEWPSDVGVVAEAGVVIDADSGAMIFGQNSKLPYYPASITKLLTALVVLEHASLDERVTFSNDAVYNVEADSGNPVGLDVGDELSVKDCLYAMLLRSSNQAANALAEHVGETREGFVDMMNAKVAEIGCTESKFKNPSGLNDPEQVVTPYEMAIIARAAFRNDRLLEIASTKSYTLPPTKNHPEGFTFTVEHKILKAEAGSQLYCKGAVAGKTGYTSLAGSTLVTYAERDGRRLIAVILKGKPTQYYLDTINLLNFGFERFQDVDVSQKETSYLTGEEPVAVGDKSYLPEELEFYAPAVVTLPLGAEYTDADKTFDIDVPAGSPEGTVAVLRYTYNNRKVGEVFLRLKQEEPEAGEVNGTVAEPGGTETESGSAEPEPGAAETGDSPDDSKKAGTNKPWNPGITTILIGIAAVLVIIVGVGVFFWSREVKKEREQKELRKEKRRQRLIESGITEEEFNHMVEERRSKGRNQEEQ